MQCAECRKNDVPKGAEYCDECRTRTKECKACLTEKTIFDFEKNRRTPLGAVNRRSDSKACRKGTKKASPAKVRREFEAANPRPAIGDSFQCSMSNMPKAVHYQ